MHSMVATLLKDSDIDFFVEVVDWPTMSQTPHLDCFRGLNSYNMIIINHLFIIYNFIKVQKIIKLQLVRSST